MTRARTVEKIDLVAVKSKLEIRSLNESTLPDFLQFVERDAFTDNPKWSSCYCQCFYEDHSVVDWSARTATENRSKACERVALGAMQGRIAFLDGKPVRWCVAAPRHLLRALDGEPTPDAEHVGAIVCFLVAPSHRGKGVARALLEAACESLRSQGMRIAEAYPRSTAASDAENHVGPLHLYLSSGFSIHRTDSDGSLYVRRSL